MNVFAPLLFASVDCVPLAVEDSCLEIFYAGWGYVFVGFFVQLEILIQVNAFSKFVFAHFGVNCCFSGLVKWRVIVLPDSQGDLLWDVFACSVTVVVVLKIAS